MKINADLRGQLPPVPPPQSWQNGRRRGWSVKIPGGRPLATPAVVDGRVFLGGGFGSYDFYAFDAGTGRGLWQYQTEDDGPTAAVVDAGLVAFNTESCELEVLTIAGRRVWKKWLGDPLMSMPALANGRVFQVYPDTHGDRRHYLGAFQAGDGTQLGKQPLPGEIITAPVLADECVYVTNLDGSMSCFHQSDGGNVWHEPKQATSSPAVHNGACFFSQRREVVSPRGDAMDAQQMEELAARAAGKGGATFAMNGTAQAADYLDYKKRKAGSKYYATCQDFDGSVGFAHFKGDAKMEQAQQNLGHGHVSSLWSYQGSKPFLSKGFLYSAMADTLNCVRPDSQEVLWKRRLYEGKQEEILDHVLTPPATVNGKLFVGSIFGEVCCLAVGSGDVIWRETIGEPVIFQPAVVGGRVYVGTAKGTLFCLETGDPADDGWHMWGASAQHNGLAN